MDVTEAVALAHRIGRDVAGAHAADVDAHARFPKETVDALREERLLGALVPAGLGGLGQPLPVAAAVVRTLGRYCASSAMILAMHHIKVLSLVRHLSSDALRDYARRVAAEQLLLASATTEMGIGGDLRRSSCFVERDGDRFRLTKHAPVISYGEYADAILTSARKDADAAPNDQVLVVCETKDVSLTPLTTWDTLGFRGTCSNGFTMEATGPADLVLAEPWGDITARTVLPAAHLLWSSLWLGIAEEASWRAQRFVQKAARKNPGTTPPGATRLADLLVTRQRFASSVEALLDRYVAIMDDPEALSSVDFMVAINTLKISASTDVVDVVNQAMLVCGIAGYREDSEFSLGRLLRDAHGAAIMVNNDRIAGNTAQLALMQREA